MATVLYPLKPLHMAVRKNAAVELQFLAADHGELLSDAHHRAVEGSYQPAALILTELIVSHIAFLPAQFHQVLEALLQGVIFQKAAVELGLVYSLSSQKALKLFRTKVGR